MSFIRDILDAEKKASSVIEEAKQRSEKLALEAKADAEQGLEVLRQSLADERSTRLKNQKDELVKTYQEVSHASDPEIDGLSSRAQRKTPEAVAFVLSKI